MCNFHKRKVVVARGGHCAALLLCRSSISLSICSSTHTHRRKNRWKTLRINHGSRALQRSTSSGVASLLLIQLDVRGVREVSEQRRLMYALPLPVMPSWMPPCSASCWRSIDDRHHGRLKSLWSPPSACGFPSPSLSPSPLLSSLFPHFLPFSMTFPTKKHPFL